MFIRNAWKRIRPRCYVVYSAHKRCMSQEAHKNSPLNRLPLKDVRVCDFTSGTAGPYCTMLLGDHGADIIKIETPDGDESRKWGPPFAGNESCMFLSVNRNKRSVCIDIEQKQGADILYEIVKASDVFISNHVSGKLVKPDFGFEELKQINPRLIYVTISGFGSYDPYRKKPGYDIIASAFGGLSSITGPKDGDPCVVGVPVIEIMTALYTSSAVTAALFERRRTNRGKKIETSLLQTQLAFLSHLGANYLNAGTVGKPLGTGHTSIVPYQVNVTEVPLQLFHNDIYPICLHTCRKDFNPEAFHTADEMIILAGTKEKMFQNVCTVLGIPDIPKDPRFATNKKRVDNRKLIIDIIQNRLLTAGSEYWISKLESVGVPCATINTVENVFNDPQVKALEMIQEYDHPSTGTVRLLGPPVEYDGQLSSSLVASSPPLLGQHTCDVVETVLGYSKEKIDSLLQNNVLKQSDATF